MADATCRRCEQPFSYPRSSGGGRSRSLCDPCRAIPWRARNPAKEKATKRAWQLANADAVSETNRQWRLANADLIREKTKREWAATKADPAALLLSNARHRRFASRPEHREKARAVSLAWRQANPEKFRDQRRNYRARRAGANVADFTEAQWRELLAEYEHRCAYCGSGATPLQRDHVKPIARDGDHTKSNIVPACRPCNLQKSARNVDEFLRELAQQGRYAGRYGWRP